MPSTNEGLTPDVIRALVVDAVRAVEWDLTSDDLYDWVPRYGEEVFSLYWDSGGPGAGAGIESVYRFADRYLACSDTFGWSGPYDTLEDAYGSIFVSSATKEISSSEWSDDEIIARMDLQGPGPELVINGTRWPLETLEHRHAQLRRERERDGSPDAPEDDEVPELLVGPAIRMPDGDIFRAQPPADPADIPTPELREAGRLTTEGEQCLDRQTRDLPRAELRFRAALERYQEWLEEPHPRLSYLLDRIGLACHMQGRLAEAEVFYRRSLAILDAQDGPTRWNEVTILNLAALLDAQGRDEERARIMERYRP